MVILARTLHCVPLIIFSPHHIYSQILQIANITAVKNVNMAVWYYMEHTDDGPVKKSFIYIFIYPGYTVVRQVSLTLIDSFVFLGAWRIGCLQISVQSNLILIRL